MVELNPPGDGSTRQGIHWAMVILLPPLPDSLIQPSNERADHRHTLMTVARYASSASTRRRPGQTRITGPTLGT
jgi:hypothetical protein